MTNEMELIAMEMADRKPKYKVVPVEPTTETLIAISHAMGVEPLSDGSDGSYPITGSQSTALRVHKAATASPDTGMVAVPRELLDRQQAPAEQAAEPVAWMLIDAPEMTTQGWEHGDFDIEWTKAAETFAQNSMSGSHPLYTAPPDQSARIAGLLNRIIPRIDAGGPNPIDPDIHCCEWTLHRERERIHAEFADALAAHRRKETNHE